MKKRQKSRKKIDEDKCFLRLLSSYKILPLGLSFFEYNGKRPVN
jgi:hypothetical protein